MGADRWFREGRWRVDEVLAVLARAVPAPSIAFNEFVPPPVADADAVDRVEGFLGQPLPSDYRAFMTTVADGGPGPGHGFWPLWALWPEPPDELESRTDQLTRVGAPFLWQSRADAGLTGAALAESDDWAERFSGLFSLGWDVSLVVAGPQRGQVFADDEWLAVVSEKYPTMRQPPRHEKLSALVQPRWCFAVWYSGWLEALEASRRVAPVDGESRDTATLAAIWRHTISAEDPGVDAGARYLASASPAVQAAALRMLWLVDSDQAHDAARRFAEDEDVWVRTAALDVLAQTATEQDMPMLERLLAGPDGNGPASGVSAIRVATALRRVNGPRAAELLERSTRKQNAGAKWSYLTGRLLNAREQRHRQIADVSADFLGEIDADE